MKLNVYVIARISQDAHAWTDTVCDSLPKKEFEVFRPKDHNPWNKLTHEKFSKQVFQTDLNAMKRSHVGLMLPEYGRDCAWEAGWFAHSDKFLVIFIDTQTQWLRDWMVKGGIDCVITPNLKTYRLLRQDPILLRCSIVRIASLDQLGQAINLAYERRRL